MLELKRVLTTLIVTSALVSASLAQAATLDDRGRAFAPARTQAPARLTSEIRQTLGARLLWLLGFGTTPVPSDPVYSTRGISDGPDPIGTMPPDSGGHNDKGDDGNGTSGGQGGSTGGEQPDQSGSGSLNTFGRR